MTGRPDVARRLGALSVVARVGLFNGNEARFMYPTTKNCATGTWGATGRR